MYILPSIVLPLQSGSVHIDEFVIQYQDVQDDVGTIAINHIRYDDDIICHYPTSNSLSSQDDTIRCLCDKQNPSPLTGGMF